MTVTFTSAFRNDVPATTVHVRQSWGDEWTPLPYLAVDSLTTTIGGAFGRAELQYEYGNIKRPDLPTFADYAKLSIGRWFVRVTYIPNDAGLVEHYWYGVIIAETDERMGNSTGNQRFTAVTLDWLLTQKQIAHSVIALGSTNSTTIERAVPFNDRSGNVRSQTRVLVGNKSTAGGPDDVPIFAEDLSAAALWNAYEIVQYLIQYHSPSLDTDGPPWTINGTTSSYLSWFSPYLPAEGRTVYDLINALVDSRRGLAWNVESSESGCELNVYSYSPTAISLTGGGSIPLNTALDVETDDELQVARLSTVTDSQQEYTQVRVTGARRGACFSIGVRDGTMVNDWSLQDVADYKVGYPNAATKTLAEDKALHDTARSSDALRHVYTRFRLADDWAGVAGNGTDFPQNYVCPTVNKFSGEIEAGVEPFWRSGLRFSRRLPLREFYDYRLSAESPEDLSSDHTSGNPIETFAVANIGGTRVLTHALQSWAKNEVGPTGGVEGASSVEVVDDAPVIYVRPTSMPHLQADGDFDAVVDGSDTYPVFEWQTLICTVFVEWDSHVEAVYPETPSGEINDMESKLHIRFGDRARMDYLNQGTVLGVENGELVMAQAGGFVRNDHALLRDMARLAWEWYATPRKAIRLAISHVSSQLSVGDLVGTLDGDSVNSLVTAVRYDFRRGTTQLETQFANLDSRQMIG